MRRFALLVAGLALLAGVAAAMSGGATQAEARWVTTDLGTLGGEYSEAAAINGKGVIVGWAETKKPHIDRPVLWRGGKIVRLGWSKRLFKFGSGGAWATDVNNSGRVVGREVSLYSDDSLTNAFVWQRGSAAKLRHRNSPDDVISDVNAINDRGQMVGWADVDTDLGVAHHAMLWSYSGYVPPKLRLYGSDLNGEEYWCAEAYDINVRGQVVGYGQETDSDKSPYRALLWANGEALDLGTLPGRAGSRAVAINDAGQIVGSSFGKTGIRAFLWQEGEMLNLGTLAGLPNSAAVTLNERGQVIGFSAGKAFSWWYFFGSGSPPTYGRGNSWEMPRRPRAFLWQDGTLIDLGTLGGASAIPFAINEAGQIVGQSQNAKRSWQAFVWQKGKMRALPTLGGKFSAALSINDAGQIVGWSETGQKSKGGTAYYHAVLWTLKR